MAEYSNDHAIKLSSLIYFINLSKKNTWNNAPNTPPPIIAIEISLEYNLLCQLYIKKIMFQKQINQMLIQVLI